MAFTRRIRIFTKEFRLNVERYLGWRVQRS